MSSISIDSHNLKKMVLKKSFSSSLVFSSQVSDLDFMPFERML